MTFETAMAIVEVIAVLVAIIGLWVTLKGIRDQLWIGIFTEYTGRYSEIMDNLPFEARVPGGDFDLDKLPESNRKHILATMRRYLNLCSEELYLHSTGKIDRQAWDVWNNGIRDTIRLPAFRKAWGILRREYDYYSDFCAFIDGLTADVQ